MLRGLKQTLGGPGPTDPQRLRQNYVCVSYGGMGQQWTAVRGKGSGYSRSGYGISPIRAAKSYTGLGKRTLGGHRQNLVHTRTQEEGAVTPQETDPDLPVSV